MYRQTQKHITYHCKDLICGPAVGKVREGWREELVKEEKSMCMKTICLLEAELSFLIGLLHFLINDIFTKGKVDKTPYVFFMNFILQTFKHGVCTKSCHICWVFFFPKQFYIFYLFIVFLLTRLNK